jgi:hypothetical protein
VCTMWVELYLAFWAILENIKYIGTTKQTQISLLAKNIGEKNN